MLGKRKNSQTIEDLIGDCEETPKQESNIYQSVRVFMSNIEPNMNESAIYKLVQKIMKNGETGLVSMVKGRNQTYCILKFDSSENRNNFEKQVNQDKTKCKGRNIRLKPVTKHVDTKNELTVAKLLERQNRADEQRYVEPTEEDIQEIGKQSIVDKICPLHHLPYEEQIATKKQHIQKIIDNLNKQLQENPMQEPISLDKFILADQLTKYRNKEEFTFGFDHLQQLQVGFTKGDFKKNVVLIDSPKDCLIASDISIEISDLVADFAREVLKSKNIIPYNKLKHQGFWRNMVVRDSCNTNQVIVNLVVADKQVSEAQFEEIKQDLKKLFENHFKNNAFTLKCLAITQWNDMSDCTPTHVQPIILLGEENVYEEHILDKKFLVSSSAFLQIHIPQCNKLYSSIIEELEIDDNTTFLDICSGIGTIGLCMAGKAHNIVQVEMIESACEDAKRNAKLNNIQNVEVFASKIEDCVKDICKSHDGKRLVGVLDPPRSGMHHSVCQALRTLKGLNNLVYVACNASAVQDNILQLCLNENKNKRKGPPFRVTKIYTADLFPQTSHYETVFVLER